jgi:hypothetical protein
VKLRVIESDSFGVTGSHLVLRGPRLEVGEVEFYREVGAKRAEGQYKSSCGYRSVSLEPQGWIGSWKKLGEGQFGMYET